MYCKTGLTVGIGFNYCPEYTVLCVNKDHYNQVQRNICYVQIMVFHRHCAVQHLSRSDK